ncbi:hypothetical protein [Butyrivibrio sp. FCS014]|uniref:hypothetical protein n=1 Tax=Butyrivibrio sp. FCS014 TaxID=1408304 RepID=UPI0004656702|nr:hypothetical protein [Butyrivibrio sp. FCS014]
MKNEEYSFSDYLKENKKKPLIIALVVLALIAVVFVCTGIFTHRYGVSLPGMEASTETPDEPSRKALEPIDRESVDLSNVKIISELDKVDLTARKHASGSRQRGMEWDEGFLNMSGVKTQYRFIDKADGKELSCEVYTEDDGKTVNRIITYKEAGDGRPEIIEYFYRDNKPYFIYKRNEEVYTPAYDSTDKPGVRFYFKNDVLVRSRTVVEGTMLVSQTGLYTDNNPDYEEFEYYTAPDVVKLQYDRFEQEWLNKAYNILDAVKSTKSIGRVCGTVKDDQGKELSGLKVLLQKVFDGNIIYASQTDSQGAFSINVKLDGDRYRLCVLGNETLSDAYIYDLAFDHSIGAFEYDNIVLYPRDEEVCDVTFNVYDADTYRTGDSGKSGVFSRICIREGLGNRLGDKMAECYTNTKGEVETALKPGFYTLETVTEGYCTDYTNIEVTQYGCKKNIFVVTTPAENTAKVILSWDSDADLDMTVFTPAFGTRGDMDRIRRDTFEDSFGNHLVWDNADGCELAVVNLSAQGGYRTYVSNYTDISSGAYGSRDLCESNPAIHVYYDDGSCEVCELNDNRYGVLWEAAELSKSGAAPGNRFYSSVSGKSWWLENKSINGGSENTRYKSGMQIKGRLESDFSYAYASADWTSAGKYSLGFDDAVNIVVSDGDRERTINTDRVDIKLDLTEDFSILSHLDLHVGQYVSGSIKEIVLSEEGKLCLVLESLTLLQDRSGDEPAVPMEYLGLLADRIKDGPVAYSVIYVNDNQTPELVILSPRGVAHENGADIYTYDNGSVDLIGSFGFWGGNFTYYPMKNMISVEETGSGSHMESYCSFDKYTVSTVNYESSLDFPEYGISKVNGQYTMNGTEYVNPIPGRGNAVPTTPEEYQKQMKTLFGGIDRNTGRYVDLDSCQMASRIEDIKFK